MVNEEKLREERFHQLFMVDPLSGYIKKQYIVIRSLKFCELVDHLSYNLIEDEIFRYMPRFRKLFLDPNAIIVKQGDESNSIIIPAEYLPEVVIVELKDYKDPAILSAQLKTTIETRYVVIIKFQSEEINLTKEKK